MASSLAVGLLLSVLVYTVVTDSRLLHEQQARAVAEGMAAIAQVSLRSEFDRVDAVLRATVDEVQRIRSAGEVPDELIHDVLASRLGLLEGVEALRIADARGAVRWGNSLPPGAPADVSSRDFFTLAQGPTAEKTIVSGPFQSRVSGNWVVAFVRPIQVGGQFDGVVYVSISVSHFRTLFERYSLADRDAIALRRDDMRLLARRSPGSPSQGDVGSTNTSAELRAELDRNPEVGTFVGRVAVDGVERTSAYRAVTGWPFVVFAGINNERFFRPWAEQATTVGVLATLAWGLVVLAATVVYRAGVREAAAMRGLADQTERTRALLHIAGDGIHIVDRQGRLVEMSDSFAEMLRSTRKDLLGRPVWSWDVNQDETRIKAWLNSLKDGDKQRVDVQHRRDDGTVIDVELQMRATLVDGQLLVFASGRDVTDSRKVLLSLQQAREDLSHAAFHDALTQLPNRLLLADRMKQCVATAARDKTRLAVCYLDLDGFKSVNDRLGHDAGDALLVEVARRLTAAIRPSDTAARLGGDEFVLLLASLHGDEWQSILERVSAAVAAPIRIDGHDELSVGITVGVALSDGGAAAPSELLARADQAMLHAKRSGKGRVLLG